METFDVSKFAEELNSLTGAALAEKYQEWLNLHKKESLGIITPTEQAKLDNLSTPSGTPVFVQYLTTTQKQKMEEALNA
jgi:hypothetical protein